MYLPIFQISKQESQINNKIYLLQRMSIQAQRNQSQVSKLLSTSSLILSQGSQPNSYLQQQVEYNHKEKQNHDFDQNQQHNHNQSQNQIPKSPNLNIRATLFKIFIVTIVLIILFILIKIYENYLKQQYKYIGIQPIKTNINEDQISGLVEENHFQKHLRNLNVYNKNCCLTGNTCGVFVEDCCVANDNGCYMYVFCYEKWDDSNCLRVSSLVKKMDGYWAV